VPGPTIGRPDAQPYWRTSARRAHQPGGHPRLAYRAYTSCSDGRTQRKDPAPLLRTHTIQQRHRAWPQRGGWIPQGGQV